MFWVHSLVKPSHHAPATMEDSLRAAFKIFDKDGTGAISGEELAAILSNPTAAQPFGEAQAADEANKIIRNFDSACQPGV